MATTPTHGDHRIQFSILFDRLQRLFAKPWLPRIVNASIVTFCASMFALWTWEWIAPGRDIVARAEAAPAPQAKPFDMQKLLAAHLFGQAEQRDQLVVEALPVSTLNLILSGVVAGESGGLALIKVNDLPEAPFAVGQEIVNGAVLQAVYADRIVISRGGASESVLLKDVEPGSPPASNAAAARPRATGAGAATAKSAQVPSISALLQAGSVSPRAGGGLALDSVQPNSLYERAGLRAGDVIRSANGMPVNSMADALRLYQQSGGRPLRVDIVRDGKPQTVTINLE